MSAEDETRIWARRDRDQEQPAIRSHARKMRAAPTEAEKRLWWHLRHRMKSGHFRRQVLIAGHIADFACHRAKLIVEVDGGQHPAQTQADIARTCHLEAHGYRVLRFWNNDVLANTDGVLLEIQRALTMTPTPIPSPHGEGKRVANRRRLDLSAAISSFSLTPGSRRPCRAPPGRRRAARSARGTASTTHNRARPGGRTRPMPDRRHARHRYRP